MSSESGSNSGDDDMDETQTEGQFVRRSSLVESPKAPEKVRRSWSTFASTNVSHGKATATDANKRRGSDARSLGRTSYQELGRSCQGLQLIVAK